jgi:Mitochondrial ribosomal protein (VAR1)
LENKKVMSKHKNKQLKDMMNFDTNNKNINNNLNISITKNDYNEIIIDKRILPLFKTPVILKKLSDRKRNKYNFNLKSDNNKKITFKLIPFKEILNIFLKGINLYNNKLNHYLETHNNKELILDLKNDDLYKLNINLSNYLYLIKKFMPIFKFRSLIYKVRLFFPKRLLKPQPYIKFLYRFRKIDKFYKEELIYKNKRDKKIKRREITKLLAKGKKLINEIESQIIIKKNIITNLKNIIKNKQKNKFLTVIKSLFPIVTDNTNNNNNNINNYNNINKSYLKDSSSVILDKNKSYFNLTQKERQYFQSKLDETIEDRIEYINKNRNELIKDENKIINNKNFNIININNTNKSKIEHTLNSIFKYNEFDYKNEAISIYSNPVVMLYTNFKKYSSYIINNNNNKENNNYNSIVSDNIQPKPIINQYLKSMSSYNRIKKGIFMSYSNIIGFNFNTERNKLITNIYKLLAASFKSMYCLISKPVFVMTPDKIIIQLFYFLFIPNILKFKKIFKYKYRYKNGNRYRIKSSKDLWFKRKRNIKKQYRKFKKKKINVRINLRKLSNVVITKVFKDKFKILCHILSRLFKKPVQLDLIRLHYPYNDSNILVNLLAIMINKIKLRIIFRRLFEKAVIKNLNKVTGNTNYNIIPAFLSGINIRVAGRLLTHRVVPRKTVKTIRRGAAATGKINFSDVARYTKKNKRGAFSISVSSGQNFF